MNNGENYKQKLARAQKRVASIKKFYRHLRIFIIANLILLFFKFKALNFFEDKGVQDQDFLNWFEWNIIGTPVLWGIGLVIHAVYVFSFDAKPFKELKPKFLKEWEERQIRKFMENEGE